MNRKDVLRCLTERQDPDCGLWRCNFERASVYFCVLYVSPKVLLGCPSPSHLFIGFRQKQTILFTKDAWLLIANFNPNDGYINSASSQRG